MSRDYFEGRRIWLVGASTGIGLACAHEFAARGARLVLSSRSHDKLHNLATEIGQAVAAVVPLDVTDLQATRRAAAQARESLGGIDTYFFNAGTWEPTDLDPFDPAIFHETMQVNFQGMVNGIHTVWRDLAASPRGHLVGMCSSVAYRGIPRAEAYCASKAAVRAMLQALRCQLRPHRVPVSIVLPGFVKSPLTDKNDFAMPFLMEAQDAARRIADGMARHRSEIAFPWPFILALKAMSLLPDGLYTRLMSGSVVKT